MRAIDDLISLMVRSFIVGYAFHISHCRCLYTIPVTSIIHLGCARIRLKYYRTSSAIFFNALPEAEACSTHVLVLARNSLAQFFSTWPTSAFLNLQISLSLPPAAAAGTSNADIDTLEIDIKYRWVYGPLGQRNVHVNIVRLEVPIMCRYCYFVRLPFRMIIMIA
jgi:hypothetical protein